jgi:hypothetical protein
MELCNLRLQDDGFLGKTAGRAEGLESKSKRNGPKTTRFYQGHHSHKIKGRDQGKRRSVEFEITLLVGDVFQTAKLISLENKRLFLAPQVLLGSRDVANFRQ